MTMRRALSLFLTAVLIPACSVAAEQPAAPRPPAGADGAAPLPPDAGDAGPTATAAPDGGAEAEALRRTLEPLMALHLNSGTEAEKPFGMVLRVESPSVSSTFAFGALTPTEKQPVTGHERWVIGSVSKVITAFMVAQAVEEGRLRLDAPLGTYLPPDFRVPSGPGGGVLMLRHLLAHTGGLPRYPATLDRSLATAQGVAGMTAAWQSYTKEHLREDLATTELSGEPGARYTYSDFGFALAQLALEHSAGEAYATLLKKALGPLGMTNTVAPEELPPGAPGLMPGHSGARFQPAGVVAPRVFTGDGFIYSSAADFGRFLRVLGRLDAAPSPAIERAIRAMETPRFAHTGPGGVAVDQGLGIGILPRGVATLYKKNGVSTGTSTCMIYEPVRHVAVILGANGAPVSTALNTACCAAFMAAAEAAGVRDLRSLEGDCKAPF